jgi:hypothetical protein
MTSPAFQRQRKSPRLWPLFYRKIIQNRCYSRGDLLTTTIR